MTERLDYTAQSPAIFQAYLNFSMATHDSAIERPIIDLVNIRASQMNGCAFCLDMHVKEAAIHGERPLRLHHVAIWRESTMFSARERACLAWTEALTRLPDGGVSDGLYAATREHLSEKEITDLTAAIMAINGWNRVGIAFNTEPGSKDDVFGLRKSGLS